MAQATDHGCIDLYCICICKARRILFVLKIMRFVASLA